MTKRYTLLHRVLRSSILMGCYMRGRKALQMRNCISCFCINQHKWDLC